MKKNKILGTLILLGIISSFNIIYSQCQDPKKIVKSGGKDKYVANAQSKSGALIPGDTYELIINTQEGFDYKVTIAADDKRILVPFEIIEIINEKVPEGGFKKTKKVLKTSSGDTPLEIKADKTGSFTIVVNLPENDSKNPECVGILVEDRKSIKIGF